MGKLKDIFRKLTHIQIVGVFVAAGFIMLLTYKQLLAGYGDYILPIILADSYIIFLLLYIFVKINAKRRGVSNEETK